MKTPLRTALLAAAALLLAAPAARAADCGPLPAGKNPSVKELAEAMEELSGTHGVPTEIIKGIAYQESRVQQWRSDGTFVVNTKDCGLGMMQLTGATAKQFDVERLKRDWKYNLECGVTVLKQKWARAERQGLVPAADPAARRVLENWYYAVAFYWGGKTESYLTKIFSHIENRPGVLSKLLRRPVKIVLPGQVMKGFAFGDKFLALPDGTWVDAKGKRHTAPVHLGTIGDARTLAELDVTLERARRAVERERWRDAIKYYQALVGADRDTIHAPEAKTELARIEEKADELAGRIAAAMESGDFDAALDLARDLARNFRGLPHAERAREQIATIKDAARGS